MTSPVNSLRKSFGNILTKITSRPSIEGNEEVKQVKASAQPCVLCGVKGKHNIQCRTCSKFFCVLHSSVTAIGNNERTCDDCIHISIVNEISKTSTAKDKISQQIQELVGNRDATTKLLNKENTRVRALQYEIKEASTKLQAEKIEILKKIQTAQQEKKILEDETQKWSIEASKIKAIVEHNEKKRVEIQKESEHYNIAVDEMIKERTILLSNLNEVRDFIRLQVPVRIIKKLVCSSCYIAVQNGFAGIFKNVVPIKSEQMIKERPKKQGACASCALF